MLGLLAPRLNGRDILNIERRAHARPRPGRQLVREPNQLAHDLAALERVKGGIPSSRPVAWKALAGPIPCKTTAHRRARCRRDESDSDGRASSPGGFVRLHEGLLAPDAFERIFHAAGRKIIDRGD